MEQLQEGLQIALGCGYCREILPNRETGQSIVGFGLHQQTLRICHFYKRRQSRLVARPLLVLRGARGLQFHRRVLCDLPSALERSLGLSQLAREILQSLVIARGLRPFVCCFNCPSRSDRKDVEYGKGDTPTGSPIAAIWTETVRASEKIPRGID